MAKQALAEPTTIKQGLLSTEFWVIVIPAVMMILNAVIGLYPEGSDAWVVGVLGVVYAACRTVLKVVDRLGTAKVQVAKANGKKGT